MPKFTSFFFFQVGVKMGSCICRGVCNYYRLKQQTFFSSYKQYRDCISGAIIVANARKVYTQTGGTFYFVVHPKCTKQLTIDNNKILL